MLLPFALLVIAMPLAAIAWVAWWLAASLVAAPMNRRHRSVPIRADAPSPPNGDVRTMR